MDFEKYFRRDKIFTSTLKRGQAMLLPTVSFCTKHRLKRGIVSDSGIDPAVWLLGKSNMTLGHFEKEHWLELYDNATFSLEEVVSKTKYFEQVGNATSLKVEKRIY